ncbi:Probable aspartic protease At2g35615 [Linum perenne]
MSPYSPLQFFLFIISTLIFSTSHGLNITIPLIHRDSIYSPLYNAAETIEERAQRVTKASLDRYEYLSSALSIRPEANLVPGFQSTVFYMNFSIGTPPVPQLVLMDTGSALLWVKCKPCRPCNHGPKDPPIFDPVKSSTIYEVPCEEKCKKCTGWSPWTNRKCKFTLQYVDGRVSEGIYMKDRLTFQTSANGRTSETIESYFGCSNHQTNKGTDLDKHFSGVIGLGPSKPEGYLGVLALIWDLGSKFSYCVGRFSDHNYPYNSISFGANANMIGMETPMYTGVGTYHVNLLNISIGNKILNIDPKVFKSMSRKYGGMLVDSGSETTLLPDEALDVIKAEVKRIAILQGMKQLRTTFGLGMWKSGLCFTGTVFKDAHGFPPMGFHFEQGDIFKKEPEVVLKVQSFGLFDQIKNDIFCLDIHGTKQFGEIPAILGMSAQQEHNFGFDMYNKLITFENIDSMSPYSPLQFFIFIISTLIFSTSHGLNITIPLIHRDSIYSPLYNATETIEDRAQRVAKASLDRYEYLSSALSIRPEATLVPGFQSSAFYMNISIGTPSVPQLVLMDTGSALLWVKCKPCKPCIHDPKDPPIFDPVKSSTIYEVPCQKKCKTCTAWFPWTNRKCKFTQTYADGRVSEGIYMKDRLTFQTSANGRTSETLETYFGCSNHLTNKRTDLDKHFSGIIGLGPSKPEGYLGVLALIWDLGSKFSYCIGRFSDRNYPYNSISFGVNANMIGMETPMYTAGIGYHVNLLNISIGDKILNIDPKVFKSMLRKHGGMAVDSGSEITLLPDEAFDVIKAEVTRLARLQGLKKLRSKFAKGIWKFGLCFIGSIFRDAHGFPPMGFHFEQGGLDTDPEPVLKVQSFGLFRKITDDIFCLGIISNKQYGEIPAILGMPQGSKLVPGMYISLFFVNFTIGDPPLPQLALVDTGSPILWLRSTPCVHWSKCIHRPGWIFSKYCKFTINYVDGDGVQGIYVTDDLTFLTSSRYQFTVAVKNILFGYNTDTTPPEHSLDYRFSGIMGLGPSHSKLLLGYPSLVSKLGSRLSYCVGLLSDLSYPHNQISFGGASNFFGASTPFVGSNYFVRIINISIGREMLNIDPQEFQMMSRKQGISVDSGTELTFLPPAVLGAVREGVQTAAFFRGMEEVVSSGELKNQLCYKGTVDKEAQGFPPLGFHFQDGAQLQVESVGMFIQVENDKFCLALLPTNKLMTSISIIGMRAQQGYNVGFDVYLKRVYFQPLDCGVLSVSA